MKICILISTIDSGINNVKNILLPFRDDLSYFVSHQYTSDKFLKIPIELKRIDVKIDQIFGKGISKSRNNAIRKADADICILADDDISYKNEYIDIVKQTYLNNQDLDIACFKIKTNDGEPEYKEYLKLKTSIDKPFIYYISSIELTFNLKKLRNNSILFDERFGIGSHFFIGGEETLFINDCLNANLKIVFYPHYIVNHQYESNDKKLPIYDKKLNMVRGGLYARNFTLLTIFKIIFKTILLTPNLIKNKKNPFKYIYELGYGFFLILFSTKNHK